VPVVLVAYLLTGMAAFWVSGAAAMLFAIPHYDYALRDQGDDPSAGAAARVFLLVIALAVFVASALTLLLAYLHLTGRQTVRVLTWVLCGVAGLGAVGVLLGDGFRIVPWLGWVYVGVCLVTVASAACIAVFLGTGSTTRFIRAAEALRRSARPPVFNPYAPPALPLPPRPDR
jgi:hypothetical protein